MSKETRETTALSQRLKRAVICWSSKELLQDGDDDPGSGPPPPPIQPDKRSVVPPTYELSAVVPPRYRYPSPPPSPPPSYEASLTPGYDAPVPACRITSEKLPPRNMQRPTAPSAAAVAGRETDPHSAKRSLISATTRNTSPAPAAPISRPITPEPASLEPVSPLAATPMVTEVIDAVFVQGSTVQVSRVKRRGYLSLYFQASAIGALPRVAGDGALKFVLNDAAAIDCSKSAQNVQLRRELHETPSRKIFVVHHRDLVSHLRQLHRAEPRAVFYQATVAKYEIPTSDWDSSVCPLILSARWLKESATLLSLNLYYEPNESAVHPATEFSEGLELLANVPSTWRLSSSYPRASEVTDQGVTWSISKLEQRGNALVAKFQLDSSYAGEYSAKVSARFRCSGATLSGSVKLDMVHAVDVWPIHDVRVQLKSGHYYCT